MMNGEAEVEPDDGAAGGAQNLNRVRKTTPWMVKNGRGEDGVVADMMVTETWAWSMERGRGCCAVDSAIHEDVGGIKELQRTAWIITRCRFAGYRRGREEEEPAYRRRARQFGQAAVDGDL
jgi:hypothetical protein